VPGLRYGPSTGHFPALARVRRSGLNAKCELPIYIANATPAMAWVAWKDGKAADLIARVPRHWHLGTRLVLDITSSHFSFCRSHPCTSSPGTLLTHLRPVARCWLDRTYVFPTRSKPFSERSNCRGTGARKDWPQGNRQNLSNLPAVSDMPEHNKRWLPFSRQAECRWKGWFVFSMSEYVPNHPKAAVRVSHIKERQPCRANGPS
jgi:hypothetical protein